MAQLLKEMQMLRSALSVTVLPVFILFLFILSPFVTAGVPLVAQTSSGLSGALPGCDGSPEIHKVIHEKLEGKEFDALSFVEQEALRQKVLTELAAQYPREIGPQTGLIYAAQDQEALHPGSFATVQQKYRERAKEHPDDPLMLYLAGDVLTGTDTPEAIRLLDAAKAKAPEFVWAHLGLADIYSGGAFADKQKFTKNLTAFWTACPASTNRSAQWMLVKDMALQAKVAIALRARLAAETDPDKLKQYEYLWSLEFRTHPPQEHEALRKQVAADVKRLETLNPHPGAD
jgi:hypothetical protein